MTFAPIVPAWLVLLLAALAAAALWRAYRGPSWPAALRAAAIAILAVMAANPVATVREGQRTRPTVAVAIDRSASMATVDCGEKDRYALALATARQVQAILAERCDVRVVGIGAGGLDAAPPPKPSGDTGYAALADLLGDAGSRPQAVMLLSDGADWSPGGPEEAFARAGVPIHALGLGSLRAASNAAVRLTAAAPTAFPGQEMGLEAAVSATSDLRGREVRLLVEAVAADGSATTVLDERFPLAVWTTRDLSVPVGEKTGGRLWRARIELAAEQLSREDDNAFASAQVVDRSLKIAVIEGRPWWDTTFAVRAWRRDRQLQVATAYRVGNRNLVAGSAVDLPPTDASLAGVDLVVLGQGVEPLIGAEGARAIARFVDRGGGLLLLGAGPRGIPELDALAACTWGDGAAEATIARGSGLPGLLPADASFAVATRPVAELAPHCRILLGDRQQPLIAQVRRGAGWVCSAGIAGVWRWQMAAPGGEHEVGERFWRQILRAMTAAPTGKLRCERMDVAVGATIAVALPPDDLGVVELTRPDGQRSTIAPAGDTVRVVADHPGLWTFARGAESVAVVARQDDREALTIARDDGRLRHLAERTGGTWGDVAQAEAIARRIDAAEVLGAAVTREEPLVTSAGWFLAVLGLLAAEWWLRRRRHGVV